MVRPSPLLIEGPPSLFDSFFFSRSFCGRYSFEDSFIRKMPVPGFSIKVSHGHLLEWNGCFSSSANHASEMTMPCFLASSSATV